MRSLHKVRGIAGTLLGSLALACGGSDINAPVGPGPATSIAVDGGNNQSAATGAAVSTPPSVKVSDANANPVSGVAVTFAVASGGGSITGANQTTNTLGIATVGSWTLGPTAGGNTLTASVPGLAGSPITFTATADAPPIVRTFQSLVAGFDHTCGLTTDGRAYCWGWNGRGQIGDGTTTDRLRPALVSGGLTFQSLAAAGAHTCGITTSGVTYCWGRNNDAELGDGTTTQRLDPTPVSGGLTFNSLVGGYFHTCGLTPAGVAHCWGLNLNGQLGDGTSTVRLTPTAVTGALAFQSLAGGGYHTCGLTTDGAAHCWGHSFYGQMGNGVITFNTFNPVPVSGGFTFESLWAGGGHNCGRTIDDLTYCWGYNTVGQVGDGTTDEHWVPIEIGTELRFQTMALGNGQSCGISGAAIAYCWGYNASGQVGDGTTIQRLDPVAVAGGLTFQSMTAGAGNHTCGLTAGGLAYCWGDNTYGGVGDGTTSPRLTPVPVTIE